MIIRPILYDIKRTITSKTVLILVAIILLISLAIIPFTSIGSTGPRNNLFQAPILYYHDVNLGAYHYLAYFSNRYGDPISGVTVTVILQGQQNYTTTVVTNSSGLAFVAINAPARYRQATACTTRSWRPRSIVLVAVLPRLI